MVIKSCRSLLFEDILGVMNLDRPVMIYDGECLFCQRWVVRWKKLTEDKVIYKPYQEVLTKFPQISKEDCVEAVQLVDVDGQVYSAAKAVLKTLTYSKGWKWLYGCYVKSKFFARIVEAVYRWIARNRG